jgi:hypothetical protein
MFRRNFLFGKDGGTANLIDVGSDDLYQPGKGYGFVTEKNRREQEGLQIRELNSSFEPMYWYQNENLTFLREDENGCYLDSAEEVAAGDVVIPASVYITGSTANTFGSAMVKYNAKTDPVTLQSRCTQAGQL